MRPGSIAYAKPDPTVGREQAGRRPVLVVANAEYLRNIPDLVIAVPLTTRDRGLPHHVSVTGADTGLASPTWALCEQVRAVSTRRLDGSCGAADPQTLATVRTMIMRFLNQ